MYKIRVLSDCIFHSFRSLYYLLLVIVMILLKNCLYHNLNAIFHLHAPSQRSNLCQSLGRPWISFAISYSETCNYNYAFSSSYKNVHYSQTKDWLWAEQQRLYKLEPISKIALLWARIFYCNQFYIKYLIVYLKREIIDINVTLEQKFITIQAFHYILN